VINKNLQSGFLLHHQDYQETSLIIDVFTHDAGRVSILAKGVRQQQSHSLGLLRPFIPLNISYRGGGSLKQLTHVEAGDSELILPGLNTYCGFYLNELIRYLIPIEEPYPDVFLDYFLCLQQLKETAQVEPALRRFEIQLMHALGYALLLDRDYITQQPISAFSMYVFDIEKGATVSQQGMIHGSTLLAMFHDNYTETFHLQEAKNLMRYVIDFHLQGKPLKSRLFISKLIKN